MAPSAAPVDNVSAAAQRLVAMGTESKDGDGGVASQSQLQELAKTDYVLRVFRCLIADLCEQFKGGHPG